jgi:hypothetical protein
MPGRQEVVGVRERKRYGDDYSEVEKVPLHSRVQAKHDEHEQSRPYQVELFLDGRRPRLVETR